MSQEKAAIVADNNTKEFKNSVIFQAARAEIEAIIKKRVQDAVLQAEIIAKWADALAEQRAKANQEAWDKLFDAMQAEINQRLKAQPIEGLLPKQLTTVNPIVARLSQQLQQFHTLKEEFAAQHEIIVNRVADINDVLVAMNADLAAVLATSAPKPEEREDYMGKVKRVVDFGIELESYRGNYDKHVAKVEDHAHVIDTDLSVIPESHSDKPALRSAAQEIHSYLSGVRVDRDILINTIDLNRAIYDKFALIMSSTGIRMAPYSAALSSNPFTFLNTPRPAFSFGRKEEEENKLFVGYAPTVKVR